MVADENPPPFPGAVVSILGHPEYGQTLTRSDGFYDLAVNGGGPLTVQITAAGALKIQRRAVTKRHGWTLIDDVRLTATVTSADTFTEGAPTAQVVRGSVTASDGDPTRSALLYFPPGTAFTNFTSPGGPLEVQVTEYTVANGLQRMPGELPPTSGYTYAVEVGIPAAAAVGVDDVTFDRDVALYVDNFTSAPVGGTVPLGHYDRASGAWMAEKSGRIIKVIAAPAGGEATLDITGDGAPETPAALDSFGITAAERTMLAEQYAEGKTLWRSAVRHFSAWDCNWAFGPPPDARPPPPPDPRDDDPEDPCERAGSIIGCESRTLGEKLPIVGTPFSLHYQSRRSDGFRNRLRINVTDGTATPASLQRAHIVVEVAGNRFAYVRENPPLNDVFTWAWDGLDAYGRKIDHGSVEARVRVGFEYLASQSFETPTFGSAPGSSITGNRAARTVTLWRERVVMLQRSSAKSLGFGGWTLDANHLLDNDDAVLFGDGHKRTLPVQAFAVDTYAGGGSSFNDGSAAVGAYVGDILDIAHAPDGALYIAADGNYVTGGRVRRVGQDGIVSTLAGVPPVVAKVDGTPALNADVRPTAIAVAPDGSVVFAEANSNQVWKIVPGPTPTLRHVAGNGLPPPGSTACPAPANDCGDGGDARNADLRGLGNLAILPDGTIFLLDGGHNRVRRIGSEGTITTYAVEATGIEQLAARADGALFVRRYGDGVLRFEPNGARSVMNETGGAPSNMAAWCNAPGSAFYGAFIPLPDDSFVLTCYGKVIVRSPEGRITRLAGADAAVGFGGDGGPALRALFSQVRPLALGDKNDVFVGDRASARVRHLTRTVGSKRFGVVNVPSEDASEVYEFSLGGRHERTLSALSGVPRFTFGYDPTSGQLTSITDGVGNVTQIARSGSTVTITAPFNQVTQLGLDGNGYLATVTNPVAAEMTQLFHSSSGLLTDLMDPRGHAHHFDYAPDGRLVRDIDATPGSVGTRLGTTSDATSWTVEISSPEGRVTRHKVERTGTFDGDQSVRERRTVTSGANLATVSDIAVDDARASTRPDGTRVKVLSTAADPRWGISASYASAVQTDVATHSMTQTESRSATLATPGDPFSVIAQTLTMTRAATSGGVPPPSVTTRVYTAGPPAKWTTTSATAGSPVVIEETLDSLERVVETKVLGSSPVALHPVQYHYDARGRVDKVSWGAREYETAYDAAGFPAYTTAPAGLGIAYPSRDANGRPLTMTLPGSRTLTMSYDVSGNVVSLTPPGQPSHIFSFDPNDRLASYAPPDLVPTLSPKDTAYARDRDGFLLVASHPSRAVSYSYDMLGRVSRRVDVVTPSQAVTTTRTYDPEGRLATVVTSDGVTLTNSWEGSLLSQQAVTGPFARSLIKTYDNFLRVSAWNIDGGAAVLVSYDGDDRITSSGGMSVTRSANGLLTGTSVLSVTDAFGFNAYGEVVSHAVSGAALAYNVSTTRDAAGRIDLRTETIGSVTHSYKYGYNAAGQLADVFVDGSPTATRSWTYDPNGNRQDGTYDAQDRLLAMAGASYTYGNNGELAKKSDASGDTLYVYDAHGNLRSVTGPGLSITYVIDGENRRIGKKVSGALVQGFVYDGARIVAELGSNGAEVARFVYATGGHSPDLMIKAGVTYRFVKDHLGSPRMVVNASTGAIAQRLDYDEWGNTTVVVDTPTPLQPFGFAGGLWDRQTNLIRFGARDYDPATGRWTSKDASRFDGGLNLYCYAEAEPINRFDPSGNVPSGAPPVPGGAPTGGGPKVGGGGDGEQCSYFPGPECKKDERSEACRWERCPKDTVVSCVEREGPHYRECLSRQLRQGIRMVDAVASCEAAYQSRVKLCFAINCPP